MPRYRVVIVGTGIHISAEHDIDSFIGFVAPRYIRAKSEEEAHMLLRRNVLIEWRNTINRDNKAGVPTLNIGFSKRVWSPFKLSKPDAGYQFFFNDEDRQQKLELETQAGAGWFL